MQEPTSSDRQWVKQVISHPDIHWSWYPPLLLHWQNYAWTMHKWLYSNISHSKRLFLIKFPRYKSKALAATEQQHISVLEENALPIIKPRRRQRQWRTRWGLEILWSSATCWTWPTGNTSRVLHGQPLHWLLCHQHCHQSCAGMTKIENEE